MIRIRQISIDLDNDNFNNLKNRIIKILKIDSSLIKEFTINKKSLDARNSDNIHYVYEVDVLVKNEDKVLSRIKSKDIFKISVSNYDFIPNGNKSLDNRPIIVGSGPAGLFAGYMLAKYGYKPIIIERGDRLEKRVKAVDKFWKNGILDSSSNVQFGEGGAGTFSDGKLNTLIKDKDNLMKEVFKIFIECGAPEEIMYIKNPHIGTDILREVVKNMRDKINLMGGEFKYNSTLTDINIINGKVKSVVVNNKDIFKCDVLILAIGHSARDTFKMLYEKGINLVNKPFAVGVRIIHDQDMINKNQYGKYYKKLGPASYKLTYTTKENRGVYSFCMCPGGYVINASSSPSQLVINGMSNYKRDSGSANSAIVVTVSNKDFGDDIFSGMKFQEELEKKAYICGKGKIPVQFVKDFFDNNNLSYDKNFDSCICGDYNFGNLNDIFPPFVSLSIKEALLYFNKKINGFSAPDTLLLGAESRTSSPIRILRDDNYMTNIKGIFPCGEGSGYSGGITTSAIDGIKVFQAVANIYKKID